MGLGIHPRHVMLAFKTLEEEVMQSAFGDYD